MNMFAKTVAGAMVAAAAFTGLATPAAAQSWGDRHHHGDRDGHRGGWRDHDRGGWRHHDGDRYRGYGHRARYGYYGGGGGGYYPHCVTRWRDGHYGPHRVRICY